MAEPRTPASLCEDARRGARTRGGKVVRVCVGGGGGSWGVDDIRPGLGWHPACQGLSAPIAALPGPLPCVLIFRPTEPPEKVFNSMRLAHFRG